MNQALVDQIASAVLYEGYILYPYRPSVKNRQRWTFGGLVPRAYSQAQGRDRAWEMQTECLVVGGPATHDHGLGAFLAARGPAGRSVRRSPRSSGRPRERFPARSSNCCRSAMRSSTPGKRRSSRRSIWANRAWRRWLLSPVRREFVLEAQRDRQPLRDPAGDVRGRPGPRAPTRRRRRSRSSAAEVAAGVFRVTVKIENQTPLDDGLAASRDEALMHGLVSTHTVLGVRDGEFVSHDRSARSRIAELAAACRNVGCWPVLVGDEGDKDTILSAPIILYDYPQIAPGEPRRPLRRHRDRRDPHAPDHDPDRRRKGGDGRRGRAGPRRPGPHRVARERAIAGPARDIPGAPALCREIDNHG